MSSESSVDQAVGTTLGLVVGLVCASATLLGVFAGPVPALVIAAVLGAGSLVRPDHDARWIPWMLRGSAVVVGLSALVQVAVRVSS